MLAAKERLSDYKTISDNDTLTLSVTTDGSMDNVGAIINCLSDTDVISMEQKNASLEDVFLKLVGTEEK